MLVLAELESDKGELIPADFKPFASGAGRRRDKFTQFWTTSPREDIAAVAARYPYRVGVGAMEIWNIFPEFRNEFVAKIERTTLEGTIVQIDQALKTTIAEDRLVSNELRLSDVDFHLWDRQHPRGYGPQDLMETVAIPDAELGQYAYLIEPKIIETTTVIKKHMFFCEYFSLAGVTSEIVPGVRFFSPKSLRERTDFLEVFFERTKQAGNFPRSKPYIPATCSGVFVIDTATENDFSGYSDALVSRIFAASALASGVAGKVGSKVEFLDNGYRSEGRGDERSLRPYQKRLMPENYTIDPATSPILSGVIRIMQAAARNKFVRAKEDFRLLALDTVEDSRHSRVPVLQLAQIWMAIERLLPFRHETTIQVCLALSALYPSTERAKMFEKLKGSYKLRSDIVHGYDFKRDSDAIYKERDFMAGLFRNAFSCSFGSKNVDEFRELLLAHVLDGKRTAWSYQPTIPMLTAPPQPDAYGNSGRSN